MKVGGLHTKTKVLFWIITATHPFSAFIWLLFLGSLEGYKNLELKP